MKREVILLTLGIFLLVVLSWEVSAECQYKENVSTGVFISNLYDNQGNRYTNPIDINNFKTGALPACGCYSNFDIKNNIDKTISINIQYETDEQYNPDKFYQKSFNISALSKVLVQDSDNTCRSGCFILSNLVNYQFITNSETIGKIEQLINQTCKKCGTKDCLNDGDLCTYDFECGSNICSNSGNTAGHCISERSDLEKRLSALESLQQSINNTLTSIQSSITFILNTLTGYDTRITKIEDKTNQSDTILPNYFRYLSATDRKNALCGYAQANSLTHIQDLGFDCTLVYKPRGNPSCRCKAIKQI